ncbi:MAG: hypothetical protein KF833_00020 [Verrucomicrobiae bacterium]|nr:hypothetical protein [Verrucomicrobiae bacterium]
MKLSREVIRLTAPVRDVRPVRNGAAMPEPGPALSEADVQAAYERGRADGEKALGEQLLQQRQQVREMLDGAIAALGKAVGQVVADTEEHLVALSLDIARKVVGEIPISVEVVEAAVHEALSQVEGSSEFQVRLHPADLELLRKVESPLLASPDDEGAVRFHGSPEVSRGGCLVQTRFGIVDARRETKLDLIQRSLLE